MEKLKRDLYRITGNEKIRLILLKDYRATYMYCWRKITEKKTPIVLYKLIIGYLKRIYHIEIPYTVSIGSGFSMQHAYNITINSKAMIGTNVTIYKGATIGMDKSGIPTIGNNVYIGLNATIVGGISVGNDVLFAPNSFCNFSVPNHSIVIGNPAVIHHKKGATDFYLLNTIET